jgi:uncharacterized protein (TIRG00374 family)
MDERALTRGRRLLVITGFLVSVALLALATARLDWRQAARTLHEARLWPWLPAAIASYLVGHLLRGLRCRQIALAQAKLSLVDATSVVVVGYAVNNLLPARLGEVARCGMFSERTGMPFAEALTITFIERVLDGLAILVVFVGASFALHPSGWILLSVRAATWVFGLAALAIVLCAVSSSAIVTAVSRITARWLPRGQTGALRMTMSVIAGLRLLRGARRGGVVAALSVAIWLCEGGMFLALLPAVGLPPRLSWALCAMVVTNLGIMVPSTPGFVGAFHFICMQALVSFGAARTVAFSYAVLVHAAFYVPITIWGIAISSWYGIKLRSAASLARAARPLDVAGLDNQPSMATIASIGRSKGERPAPPRLIAAITEALLARDLTILREPQRTVVVASAAAFVYGQVASLPARLRVLLLVGLSGFRYLVALRHGRTFCHLPLDVRARVVDAWAYGRVGLARQLFRVLRSTAVLALYEDPRVQAAFGDQLGLAATRRAVPSA